MNELAGICLSVIVSLLLMYGVRPRRCRTLLSLILVLGSPLALFQFRLLPDVYGYIYVLAWVTGVNLFLTRNRYVYKTD